jgi:molybdopterin molybdotransferase
MLPFEQALRVILDHVPTLGHESVPLEQAFGRVLAEAPRAPRPVPPDDNAALDGYTYQAADTREASVDAPARLLIVDEVAAGGRGQREVGAGEAVRIMTGAPMVAGADTVIGVEDTATDGDAVLIHKALDAGANVRRAGEDLPEGSRPFESGAVIGVGVLGVLASMGLASVRVGRRPRVAILATGDEILEVGETWRAGAIYSSNSYTLRALVRQAGAEPTYLGIVGDDADETRARLEEAFSADAVITSGGVSMGRYDHVRAVAEQIGVRPLFWKIAMKPGKPFFFGLRGQTPLFGIPGNPVSTMVSFLELVSPALARMQGQAFQPRPSLAATLDAPIRKAPGRLDFVRARLELREGVPHVTAVGRQGSGVLTSLAGANALIIVPAERADLSAGETVMVRPLGWGGL